MPFYCINNRLAISGIIAATLNTLLLKKPALLFKSYISESSHLSLPTKTDNARCTGPQCLIQYSNIQSALKAQLGFFFV